MQTRKPVVAGQFYPGDRQSCLDEIMRCLNERAIPGTLPETIVGGVVPHAGWFFSGSLAAMVFAAVKQQNDKVDTFVIFGAAHRYFGPEPAVFAEGSWQSPLGNIEIDKDLARLALDEGPAVDDPRAHIAEHSIEVQVPFIQHLFPGSKILPILTPPSDQAALLGTHLGQAVKDSEKNIVFIASTDLTHYGPRYGFVPMGENKVGLRWATEVNDKEFIDLAVSMNAKSLLESAAENANACGAGAVAAIVNAAKQMGKSKGILLAHTNSNDILAEKMAQTSSESVGYAAIVY